MQIEYLGGTAVPYRYLPTNEGFAIDLDQLRASITPNTVAIIYNDLQNPISAESTAGEREAIAQLARSTTSGCCPTRPTSRRATGRLELDHIASRHARAHGHPVHVQQEVRHDRLAPWLRRRPGRDREMLSTLNTNDESCTTHYVQWAGIEALRGTQEAREPDARGPARAPRRRMRERELHPRHEGCRSPTSTFYLFPDVTEAMDRMGYTAVGEFAAVALHQTGVSFCTREHFGRRQPGEERPLHPTRLLGHRVADIREGLGRLNDGSAPMSRIVVTGRVPDAASRSSAEAAKSTPGRAGRRSPQELLRRVGGADASLTCSREASTTRSSMPPAPSSRSSRTSPSATTTSTSRRAASAVSSRPTRPACSPRRPPTSRWPDPHGDSPTGRGRTVIRAGQAWKWGMFYILGSGLQGKTLGIVGMGGIGKATARRAKAFGMKSSTSRAAR